MLISVNDKDSRPIYSQIVAEVKRQIREGILVPGDELPSVRELADVLGVNLHTVRHAYQKLRDQGVINLRLGQRARVAELPEEPATRQEIETMLIPKLNELITEAYHLGLSAEDFRELVDELLSDDKDRGKR